MAYTMGRMSEINNLMWEDVSLGGRYTIKQGLNISDTTPSDISVLLFSSRQMFLSPQSKTSLVMKTEQQLRYIFTRQEALRGMQ